MGITRLARFPVLSSFFRIRKPLLSKFITPSKLQPFGPFEGHVKYDASYFTWPSNGPNGCSLEGVMNLLSSGFLIRKKEDRTGNRANRVIPILMRFFSQVHNTL